MQQVNKYNRDYLTLLDDYGRTPSFQLGFYAISGHGKGMAEEGFVEEWKKTTNGVVIILADPKDEAEFSYVNFKPTERYHLNQLKKDGIEPSSYKAKLYHPFSFNIPKSKNPEIEFYTFSMKDLNREDWSILSESKKDSATIKLLQRASQELKRDDGLFMFTQNVKKMTSSSKSKKTKLGSAKNFYLQEPAGTAKSISEINALLYTFQNNYFLSNDNGKYNLDYEKILMDNESYHVFLSMWLGDLKLKEFCVLHLLHSFITAIQRLSNSGKLKVPVLFVIPEIRKLCPFRPDGYKEFLAESVGDALNTIRSVGRGVSLVYDSQNWSGTDERVRNAGETFFGRLGTKDKEMVTKALAYRKDEKERITETSEHKCGFIRFEHEIDGIYRFFLPSHMHKEENYNWIETFKKNNMPMRTYEYLKKEMNNIKSEEENKVKEIIKKKIEQEELDEEEKKRVKEEKQTKKEEKESKEIDNKITPEMQRSFWKMKNVDKLSLRQISDKLKEDPLVKVKPSKTTIGNHIKIFQQKLDDSGLAFGKFEYGKFDFSSMIGDGVMKEEIEE